MFRTSSLLFLALCAALGGCATASTPDAEVPRSGETVKLRFVGLTLREFVKLAQSVTQQAYTYNDREHGDVGPFSVVGTIECKRAEFGQFFQTMLYTKGLATEVVKDGDLQVVPIRSAS